VLAEKIFFFHLAAGFGGPRSAQAAAFNPRVAALKVALINVKTWQRRNPVRL
jgi:hypothetical protein